MAATILILACLLVFGFWVGGVRAAVGGENGNRAAGVAAVAFLAVVVLDLALAASGVLSRFDRFPPSIGLFLFFVVTLSIVLARSRIGEVLARRISYAALVGPLVGL